MGNRSKGGGGWVGDNQKLFDGGEKGRNAGPPSRSYPHGNGQVRLVPFHQGGRMSERENYRSPFELSSM